MFTDTSISMLTHLYKLSKSDEVKLMIAKRIAEKLTYKANKENK